MSGTSSCLRLPVALLLALQALIPWHSTVAQSYRDMAKEAALKGDNEKAVQHYEEALSSAVKVFQEDDLELVIRRGELGEAYRAVGRWKEAIEQLDYAWRRARFDAETKKRWKEKEGDLALGFAEKLGRTCQAAGRYEDAVLAFQTCLSDAIRAERPAVDQISPAGLLADTLLLLKRDEEADQAIAQAVEAARQGHGNEPPALARDLSSLAQVYYGQLRYAKALPLAQEALTLAETKFPKQYQDKSRDLGLYQSRVGALMVLAGDDEAAAKDLLVKSRENLLKKQTMDSQELLLVELSLARLASRQADFDQCQKHSGEAWRLCKLHYPAEHPEMGRCYRQLADNFVAMEMSEDAAGLYAKALAVFENSLGKDHPLSTETRLVLVKSETQLLAQKEQALKEQAMALAAERAKREAQVKAMTEAAEKARLEDQEKERLAAMEKARLEEEKFQAAVKAKMEAEEKAREEARMAAAEKARLEEEKAQLAMKAKAEAEEKARMEAAEKARLEEEKAQLAMKAKAEAEEKVRMAAAEKARLAEEKVRKAAEEKARKEVEMAKVAAAEKARIEEAKAKKAAEQKLLEEAKAKLAEARAAKVAAEKVRVEEEKMKLAEKTKAEAEEKARLAEEAKVKAEEAKAAKLAADKEKAEAAAAAAMTAKAETENQPGAEDDEEKKDTPAAAAKKETASTNASKTNGKSSKKKLATTASTKPVESKSKPKPKPSTNATASATPRPRPVPAAIPVPEPEPEPEKRRSTVGRITGSVTESVTGVTGAVSGAVSGTVKRIFNRKKSDEGEGGQDGRP